MPLLGKKCYEAYHGRNEPCKECPTIRSISSRKVENAIVPGAKGLKLNIWNSSATQFLMKRVI